MTPGPGTSFTSAARHQLMGSVMAARGLAAAVVTSDEPTRAKAAELLKTELACLGAAIDASLRSLEQHRPLRTRRIDLCDVVRSAVTRLESSRVLVSAHGPAWVVADPDELAAAVASTVALALESSPDIVKASLGAHEATYVLRVRFTATAGLRISPVSVFDAVLPDASMRLGLPLARSVAEAHGGRVDASADGDELTIRIYLPADGLSPPRLAQECTPLLMVRQPALDRRVPVAGSRTILVVDDKPLNLAALTELLESHGFIVAQATSGAEGLEIATALEPAAIVLDVGLPDRGGIEAVRRLKADPATALIPIVALSGTESAENPDLALRAGCAICLTKPPDPAELLHSLDELCAQPAAGPAR